MLENICLTGWALYTQAMKAVKYKVVHRYQPTNTSCSPTALSIMLSHYGISESPEEIMKIVPQVKDEDGKDGGTINQQLATWCKEQGYEVTLYTFDCQIIDQSWRGLSPQDIIARLEVGLAGGWDVPSLGKLWSRAYRQSYIDYLQVGGQLEIQPAVTSKLLHKLLGNGPVLPCVCYNTLYGTGRSRYIGAETSEKDDVNGKATNHSIVIYGINEKGDFLVADPLKKPGLHTIEPERMLAAISTAQIECDNLLFQIQK